MHEMLDPRIWKQRREEVMGEVEHNRLVKALRATRKRRDSWRSTVAREITRYAGGLLKRLRALKNASQERRRCPYAQRKPYGTNRKKRMMNTTLLYAGRALRKAPEKLVQTRLDSLNAQLVLAPLVHIEVGGQRRQQRLGQVPGVGIRASLVDQGRHVRVVSLVAA